METKKILLLCVLSLLVVVQSSAKNKIQWTTGSIMTIEQESFEGKVYYDHENHVVLYQSSKKNVRSFTPASLSHFSFLDKELKVEREFVAVAMGNEYGYNAKSFLEIIGNYDTPLLRKGKANAYYDLNEQHQDKYLVHSKQFDYYVFIDGRFIEASIFMKKLAPVLHKMVNKDITMYLTKENLANNMMSTVSLFLTYYQKLQQTDPVISQLFVRVSQ